MYELRWPIAIAHFCIFHFDSVFPSVRFFSSDATPFAPGDARTLKNVPFSRYTHTHTHKHIDIVYIYIGELVPTSSPWKTGISGHGYTYVLRTHIHTPRYMTHTRYTFRYKLYDELNEYRHTHTHIHVHLYIYIYVINELMSHTPTTAVYVQC